MTREQFEKILDRRIQEVSTKSKDAERRGDDELMYKLNTAFHYLDAVRRDLAEIKD